MRVTVIGCAGSFPGPDSPSSCYLVEHDGYAVLLDLGNGALGALQRHISLDDIDAVLLSHLHADHCLDLCSFYVYRRYHPDGPRPKIPVYAPEGAADRMARAYDLPLEPGMHAEFDFRTVVESTFAVGPFTVTARRVNHPVESYGFRLEAGGHVIAYSGDTGVTPALVEIGRDADLVLFEASFLDGIDIPNLHLSAREAGALAREAGAQHLVLTHLVPWFDHSLSLEQGSAGFGAPAMLAHSGLVIALA